VFSDRFAFTRGAWALLGAGILMLLPGACTLVTHPPGREDIVTAFRDVARLSLESFTSGSAIKLAVTVPDTPQWKRLRAAWGDYGYIVYAQRTEVGGPWIIPFSTIKIDVAVLRAGRRRAVGPPDGCPYGISSNAGGDCAVAFKPDPGDQLDIVPTSLGAVGSARRTPKT
jgi:hypothetical protein